MKTEIIDSDLAISPKPPTARVVPQVTKIHGETLVDNYFWLRDKQNPEVAAYLEAENGYAEANLKVTRNLQEKLYAEMIGHIKETDIGVPYRDGKYFYYARTEQGKQYPIYCRKVDSVESPEEVILDLNQIAEGHPFLGMGIYTVSDNGHLLAYSTDFTGFRQFTLHIKDLQTGELYPERIEKVGSVVWAADDRTLFYTVEEEATKRFYRLYRHVLGTDPAEDAVVYEDPDERFNVGATRTRSRDFVLMESGSHTTTEWWYLPANQPEGEFKLIAERVQDQEYEVDHHGDKFLIRANDTGRNFRLVSAPVKTPQRENWTELVAHRADVMLAGLETFANFYVLLEREEGLPHFRVTQLKTGNTVRIEFPEPAYAAAPAQNREFDTVKFRFNYQSMITPSSVYDYDMATGESTLLKQFEVPGYDAKNYRSERRFVTASDGARIPLSIVYRADLKRDGSHPMWLTGYGSYGYSYPIAFNSNLLSLLDRGFSFGVAHIRGGGDLGKPWHDQGRMMNKKNTFSDFIASAEFVMTEKYTSPDRLIISGTSAGGLLMGAVTNLRPDLFKAVVARVPFLDVINTMLDATLPLTVPEYEEWGNPNEKPAYDYMKSYCPYTNLQAKRYPAMLVKTSFNDSQVMYWEPAKYVAKLRTLKTDQNPVLLKTNMAAGHGGASGRYDFLRETAFEFAFMLWQEGINQ